MVVEVVDIDGPNLVARGEEIQLMLVQPPEPDEDAVREDQPRGDAMAMVRAILKHDGLVMPIVQSKVTVVLLPELAFASEKLGDLRELLASSGQRVVLVAGFGLAPRQRLVEWHEAGSLGGAHVVSPYKEGLLAVPNARVNGAWILCNDPGTRKVHGWVHVKTFPEQRVEKFDFRSTPGSTIPVVRLGEGLTLAPLICSELLQDDASGQEPQEFAARSLEEHLRKRSDCRLFVATISWQHKPEDARWDVGLDSFFANSTLRPRLRVATANFSLDPDHPIRSSLTGVFRDRAETLRAEPSTLVRRVGTARTMGYLLRTSMPGVALGTLRWGGDSMQAGIDPWDISAAWRWERGALHIVADQ